MPGRREFGPMANVHIHNLDFPHACPNAILNGVKRMAQKINIKRCSVPIIYRYTFLLSTFSSSRRCCDKTALLHLLDGVRVRASLSLRHSCLRVKSSHPTSLHDGNSDRDTDSEHRSEPHGTTRTLNGRGAGLDALTGRDAWRGTGLDARTRRSAGLDALTGWGAGQSTGLDTLTGRGSGRGSGFDALTGRGAGRVAGLGALTGRVAGRRSGLDALTGLGAGRDTGLDALTGRDAGENAGLDALTWPSAGRSAGVDAGQGTRQGAG